MAHVSPSFSATLRVRLDDTPVSFARLAEAIGEAGGSLGSIDIVRVERRHKVRDVTVSASDDEHLHRIVEAARSVDGVEVLRVSDGTAVLGLGDIGPEAAMPVMEGKALLFKEFGGVDAWPICLATKDADEIVAVCKAIAPGFGGINLEDISAPRCFEIESRLRKELDIPVFHDDQHGTAIVVLAALVNALRVVDKRIEDIKIVMTGIGAAGIATTDVLLASGARRIVGCDHEGAVYRGRPGLAPHKEAYAARTNPDGERGIR